MNHLQRLVLRTLICLTFVCSLIASAQASFVYVLRDNPEIAPNQYNNGDIYNEIYGYLANDNTGALTPLQGFPIRTGGIGSVNFPSEMMKVDKLNGRLYVINDYSNTVSAYSINPTTGALTAMPFSPIALPKPRPGGSQHGTLSIHPSGSPLVVGVFDGRLASFNITATTATPAVGSPFTIAMGTSPFYISPYSTVFSRDGQYFYTGGFNGGDVFAGFSVNAATGVLTSLPGSPYSIGTPSNDIPYPTDATAAGFATDDSGRIFTANYATGTLNAFTTSSGVPTRSNNSPFSTGIGENRLIHGEIDPSQQFYLVTDRFGPNYMVAAPSVSVYRINGCGASTTLTPVAGSPFATGGWATAGLGFNQNGKFLYATNSAGRNITTFAFDAATGRLTKINAQAPNTNGTVRYTSSIAVYHPLTSSTSPCSAPPPVEFEFEF